MSHDSIGVVIVAASLTHGSSDAAVNVALASRGAALLK